MRIECPICDRSTNSLKQYRVIQSIVVLGTHVHSKSVVYKSCPSCMRAFVWKRCLINGLTSWIIGYLILLPYTIALSLATLRKGHSWPVLHGVTPEMHLNRTWVNDPTPVEKILAIMAAMLCLVPGIGVVFCWWILWKTHWCSGWVHKTANIAAFAAYFVTVLSISIYMEGSWR